MTFTDFMTCSALNHKQPIIWTAEKSVNKSAFLKQVYTHLFVLIKPAIVAQFIGHLQNLTDVTKSLLSLRWWEDFLSIWCW